MHERGLPFSAVNVLIEEHIEALYLEFNIAQSRTSGATRKAKLRNTANMSNQILDIIDACEDFLCTRQADHEYVEERCTKEPRRGTCDAICTVTSSKMFNSVDSARQSKIPLFNRPKPAPTADPTKAHAGEDVKGLPIIFQLGRSTDNYVSQTNELSTRPSQGNSLSTQPKDLEHDEAALHLDLPILVVAHKKEGEEDNKAIQGTNQLKMYLTACVSFLSTLGIREFPVYGLLTYGRYGVVICCELRLEQVPLENGTETSLKVSNHDNVI